MPLYEVIDENAFRIKPLSYSGDTIIDHLHFFYILASKPGGGKSTLLMSLITNKQAYKKLFHNIFVFSPSLHTLENSPLDVLPEEQFYDDLNDDTIQEVYDKVHKNKKKKYSTLLLLDDVQSSIKGHVETILKKMVFNRRHYGPLSIIITTQTYNVGIPLAIRKCADIIFFWATQNNKEKICIVEECLASYSKKEIEEIFKFVFKNPHDVLIIRMNDKIEDQLYRNFNKLVFK